MDTIKTYDEFLEKLTEGLISTYPIHMLEKQIIRHLRGIKYHLDINMTNDLQIRIYQKINQNLVEIIHDICIWCGYFISYIKYDDIEFVYDYDKLNTLNYDSTYWYFQIERKFDNKIIFNGTLYHITLLSKLTKIKQIGIVPKTYNGISAHPNRIYFCQNLPDTRNMVKKLKKNDELCVLELQVTKIELYNDPNSNGFYTYDNIPPTNIIRVYDENWNII